MSAKRSYKLPTLAKVEKVLGEKAKAWAGRCYEIASRCVELKLVPGVAVYGHYLGPIGKKTYWAMRAGTPFVQHGWVLLPDGMIWDPTRWSFECWRPYLFYGKNGGEYDEGGNRLRAANVRPAPAWDDSETSFTFTTREMATDPWNHVEKLLRPNYTDGQEPGTLCFSQLFWLANLPYDALQPHAVAIYAALKAIDQECLIPIDNLRRAEREAGRPL